MIRERDLEGFWRSRLDKRDPVARIGYSLWVSDVDVLKRTIQSDTTGFWGVVPWYYWEGMARTTVVNIANGLVRAGYGDLTMQQMHEKIKEVGVEVAIRHAQYIDNDIEQRVGNVHGVLSEEQMAHYHHVAFRRFGIPADYYGGTLLRSVPDVIEFNTYDVLYCFDCDSAEGFDPSTLKAPSRAE